MAKFDYIIIGAGSAGCILANRLSAHPANTVLLIEAGGRDKKFEIHVPAGYGQLHRSNVDWGCYETEPQTHLLNRKIYLPRGKTLGGCSSTNAMAYVRGNKEDYNDWAKLGNEGWDYESILPYFKKSEHNEDIVNAFHGQNGELNVTFPKGFKTPYSEAFIEACVQKGFKRNDDYNGAVQEGAGMFQFTIKDGKRHSAATAFLTPHLNKSNLSIRTNTHTSRILIEKDKAIGVEVIAPNGAKEQLFAEKEVIVSAGSFASPQLLMLSGIGDKEELKKMGIECKKELNGVGKNLQDHIFYAISASSTTQEGQNHHLKPLNQVWGLIKYLTQKKGIFTISPLEAVAFGSTAASPERVDYQLHFASLTLKENYETDMYNLKTFPTYDGFTILPTLLRPKSRGYLTLRSKNPLDAPKIQPNFLSVEEDRVLLVNTGKKALEVIQSGAFDQYRKQILCPPDSSSDETILFHIEKQAETVYHPVGTCKMGNDEMSVVNSKLQVYGIENLRVIDASIMPNIVSGNTNAPVYMIAEKGAEMILG